MKKITTIMIGSLLAFTGLWGQSSCTDLNGFVDSKNTAGTGSYTLQAGQEEMASQTYHYSGPGKVDYVRVSGNYPGSMAGVPMTVSIYDVDANGRPTTQVQSSSFTWWWFNNAAGYVNVYFGGGGVYVNNNFAVVLRLRNASPWGSSFMLDYTGNGEGLGQDLASLAGTSTGFNWTSAMTNFNKDGDFYLVPRMTHFITPEFNVSSQCVATNATVSFYNQSMMSMDSMFNTISLSAYSGSNNYYTWDFGDASVVSHATNPTHAYATAGTYTVTLTCTMDGWNNDCSYSITKVISVGLAASASGTPVSCFGGSNGSITASGSGGTSPYTYALNDSPYQSSSAFNNLEAGSYTVYVMDNLGCISSSTVTLTQPSQIVISNISSTNSSCGNADGGLLISASGGTGALQYQINSSAFQSNGSFSNLLSDFYTVTVKDANGCTATAYATVNDQGAPTMTLQSQTNVSCHGGNNGSIVVIGTGGSGQLQYSVDGGVTWQISGSFPSLAAGNYLVMVKDASGCSSGMEISIAEPAAISFAVSATPVSCNGGNDGTITASNGIGGTGTFTYSLNNVNFQSSNVFTGLPAGTYTVYVHDIASCVATATVAITQPTALVVSASAVNAGCNGSYDGSITVNATGGMAPYYYSLDGENYQSSNVFNELESSNYMVVVSDGNGCHTTATVSITQPTLINASVTTGSSTCGNANGTLLVVGGGGSGSGYQYSIDGTNFNTNGSFSGLLSGTYNIIVTDGAGCQNVFSTSINDANGPVISSISHTNVACNAGEDGTITINTVTGGTGTLQYSIGSVWQTSNVFTGLSAGVYTVLVKDANGCVGQTMVTLTEPNPIVVTTTTTNVLCHGSNSGSVTINAAGGAGTLAYDLDDEINFQSSNVFNNLYAGTYLAIVRDAAGCFGTQYFSITEPVAISMTIASLNVTCNGNNDGELYVNAIGGTGTLMFSLDGINYQSSGTFSNLVAGSYTIYVKDANGCVETAPKTISQPAVLTVNSTVSNVVCSGGNDGVIDLNVNGGTTPYYFAWSNGQSSEDIFNLVAGSYSVTVTDGNGCSYTQSFIITQPVNALVVNGVITDATTATANDGGVNLTITGGTGPYTYLWSNGATSQNLNNVSTGVYSVIVTDANGCTSSGVFFVSNISGVASQPVDASVINLYPNPAREVFTLDAGGMTIEKVEVINMLGEVVYAAETNTAKVEITTNDFSNGLYFVRMYINGERVTKRVEIAK